MSQTQLENTVSPEVDDLNKKDKKAKSRRPANTAFRQQRLKAWQPILTPKTVLPLFFAVGVIFAPLGGLLLYASSQVQELIIDYSTCSAAAPNQTFGAVPSDLVTSYFKTPIPRGSGPSWMHNTTIVRYGEANNVPTNVCTLEFTIPNDIGPPVLFYYRLTNFYQNHRRYVKSEDPQQLMGEFRSNKSIDSSECDPLKLDPETGKAYYPCGLIANSIFNDTFSSPRILNVAGESAAVQEYSMTSNGIAWPSDKELYKPTVYQPDEVVPPPNWRTKFPVYNATFPIPNLQEDEPFQVWMRTAGLPTFSKLALRNDTAPMRAGRYQVVIRDYFPVTIYGGTKSILISTRSVIGGKNPFLGIAYVVVAGICILLGAMFTVTHLIRPRKLGDHTYLSWNNDQPTAATATGRSVRQGDSA